MTRQNNQLQDAFLTKLAQEGAEAMLYLVSGVKLVGVITHYDAYSVVLERERRSQLVYKSAISTIAPMQPVDLGG